MKINYLLIPVLALLTAITGSQFTSQGMTWYRTINLPEFTPPGSLIGLVWTTIFILAAISALIYFNHKKVTSKDFRLATILFLVNAVLNILWSYIFFTQHLLGWAIIEAALLGLSVIAIIIKVLPVSKISAILLLPYIFWVSFATYLNYTIWSLNK